MIKKVIKDLNLRVIANSGQCFRMYEVLENVFDIFSADKYLRVEYIGNDKFVFHCTNDEYKKYYINYFDLKNDYSIYKKFGNSDKFLKTCISNSEGLRILNQNKFEMVISFIISQRKSVKAIQTSIERLCKLAGKKIKTFDGFGYTFPDAKSILKLSDKELNSCGFGYRKEYIVEFCKSYIQKKFDLDNMSKLTNDELIENLLGIKGVGLKVASCISLFGYHRIDICPIDVWIKRVLDKYYGGKVPIKYKKYAGMIQQYWFNYARLNKI